MLGIDDRTRELTGFEFPRGTDPQSHIGHLLRKAVDPVPPFLANDLTVDGSKVAFVRVFPASVPVLVRGTGAVYTRDDGGKRPISDHRALLELAKQGREAEDAARRRPDETLRAVTNLGLNRSTPSLPNLHMQAIVRAAPLTVTPQLSEWPITRGEWACLELADWLVGKMQALEGFSSWTRPYGRGVVAQAVPLSAPPNRAGWFGAITLADCAGVFGAAGAMTCNNVIKTDDLRREFLRPPIEAVAELLKRAEAYGDAVFDLHLITVRQDVRLWGDDGYENHRLPMRVHCGSSVLSIPADDEDRAELAKRWEREIARETGIPMWESPPDR